MLLCAVPDRDSGTRIANMLLDERLAACVQLLPVESFYRWEGRTENAAELLLLIKTRAALFDAATARIRALHPYKVPEIVAVPFSAGLADYFAWIDDATG